MVQKNVEVPQIEHVGKAVRTSRLAYQDRDDWDQLTTVSVAHGALEEELFVYICPKATRDFQ